MFSNIESILEPYIIAADRAGPRDKRPREALHAILDQYHIDEEYPIIRHNIYVRRANAGDTQAMVVLGSESLISLGEEKNIQHAYRTLYYAANLGNTDAMYWLGFGYAMDDGFGKDLALAFRWYMCAATKGHPKAMYEIAFAYGAGYGVEKNIHLAKTWAENGAKLGSVKCVRFLADDVYGINISPYYNPSTEIFLLEEVMRMGDESEYQRSARTLGYRFGGHDLFGGPINQFYNPKKAAYCLFLNYFVDSSADDSDLDLINRLNYRITERDYEKWKADALSLKYDPISF